MAAAPRARRRRARGAMARSRTRHRRGVSDPGRGAASSDAAIPPVDEAARAAARAHQALLTKPAGSLGRLEDVAAWYAAARGEFPVAPPERKALALFLADHGVVIEGVSAYGSQVTAAMACNVMAGGAAVSVLARRAGVELVAVDVGIAGDTSAAPLDPRVPLVRARVRAGTRNLRVERAMSRRGGPRGDGGGRSGSPTRPHARGVALAAVGEIGIGNTTSAAALVSVFTGAPPEETCGRGTGIDDATRARKIDVVRDALRTSRRRSRRPARRARRGGRPRDRGHGRLRPPRGCAAPPRGPRRLRHQCRCARRTRHRRGGGAPAARLACERRAGRAHRARAPRTASAAGARHAPRRGHRRAAGAGARGRGGDASGRDGDLRDRGHRRRDP